jgi:peptidoglycan/xylan/chitin deacetylase (PgdA/CDA1 family)
MYLRKAPLVILVSSFAALLSCEEPMIGSTTEESVYIAKFPGDKRAAVSFTFDDNCTSSFTKIAPLFSQHGFRCTFFIVPGSIRSATTWSSWKNLSDEGFEIGNHTMSHFNLTTLKTIDALNDQINASFDLIKTNIQRTPLSFAAPGHQTNAYIDSIVVVNHPFNRSSTKNLYFCHGWTSSTTQKDAIEHIKEAVKNTAWYVVAAHGVGDGWEPIPESLLANALQYCKDQESDIAVETFENISLYTQAREHSTVWINKGQNYQTIKIESGLSSDVYNRDLTLVVKNHQFPSPYKIYNISTGTEVTPKIEPGNRLLIRVRINNTYQIRWRER